MAKTNLEKLYESISNLQEIGLEMNDDMVQKADELEEQLIKKEILPILSQNIEPSLSKIQRNLVLVVEYTPGHPINVALSRKVKVAELKDAKVLEPDPKDVKAFQHPSSTKKDNLKKSTTKTNIKRSPKTGLCVWLPNGEFIQAKKANITMGQVIEMVGVAKVANLKIPHDGDFLVSKNEHQKYRNNQLILSKGYLLNTHSSTKTKKKQLEKISKLLKLGWKIEIIK